MVKTFLWAGIFGLIVGSAVGCRKEQFPIAPVSGIVTLDGAPLANAQVGFEPLSSESGIEVGPGSYAVTDSAGRYQLETLDGFRGAVIGQHQVSVRTSRGADARGKGEMKLAAPERVPERYNDSSMLRFGVPAEGTTQANFELKSRP